MQTPSATILEESSALDLIEPNRTSSPSVTFDSPTIPATVAPPPRPRFLWTWLAIVLLMIAVVFPAITLFTLNWFDDPSAHWVHELKQRRRAMHRELSGENRILIAGGSSALFGIDAAWMEHELQRPVLNIATHAGLELRPLLADIRALARPGDTVILQLELARYRKLPERLGELERRYDWTYEPAQIFRLPPSVAFLELFGNPLSDYRESFERWNAHLRGESLPPIWKGYSFVTLSPRGDLHVLNPRRAAVTLPDMKPKSRVGSVPGRALRDFFRYCREHRITVLGAAPPMLLPSPDQRKSYDQMHAEVVTFLAANQVAYLGSPQEAEFPAEFLLDTPNHLTAAGRRLRTQLLIDHLRKPSGVEEPIILFDPASDPPDPALLDHPHLAWRAFGVDSLRHPLCLSASELKALLVQEKAVVCVDRQTADAATAAGFVATPLAAKQVSLREWVERFPNHLILAATLRGFKTDPLIPHAPALFAEFLAHPATCKAAIFGTGSHAGLRREAFGTDRAEVSLSRYAPEQAEFRFPMDLAAISEAHGSNDEALLVARNIVNRPNRPGLALAAVDPGTGIVSQTATFSAPVETALQQWRLELPSR